MGDWLAKAEEFEKKAEKKLTGSEYKGAADLFDKAANSFKLAKSWDKSGSTYLKLANCYLKLERKHAAADAYVQAARCYKRTNINEAVSCLDHAVNLLCDTGSIHMAASKLKEIAELYESEHIIDQAVVYYKKSADFYQIEEETFYANQCMQKVAQFAAQLEQYQKSIEIYEEIARQSLNNNSLVKGHLLNAGICQLFKGDVNAINNALERYQELDPTFLRTREYRFLADIAAALDEEDVGRFTDVVMKFDSIITPLDSWQTKLLLEVKEKLKWSAQLVGLRAAHETETRSEPEKTEQKNK